MKTSNLKFQIFFILFIALSVSIFGQQLDENLNILQPLIGNKWEGNLSAPDGSASWPTTCEFKLMWEGKTVKYTFSTPKINDYAEGIFYWETNEKKIAVIIVHSSGVIKKGFLEIENGLLTMKGKISFPDRTFDFKNTFEFSPEGKMIDSWFQNAFGPWRPGHVIEFMNSNK